VHHTFNSDIILGEPFFKNYLVFFDLNNFRIGLNRIFVNEQTFLQKVEISYFNLTKYWWLNYRKQLTLC